MEERLSENERTILLKFARHAIQDAVSNKPITPPDLNSLTPNLKTPGASFVTLTRNGELRGCIGALEPKLPLVEDVREHAIASALQDFRFPPVQAEELPDIRIEISMLTIPTDLDYESPQDLLAKLRPGVDGVILRDGYRRATFLPQVWEKIPNPDEFLSSLCMKMGASPDLWRRKKLLVQRYQVEEFHEPDKI